MTDPPATRAQAPSRMHERALASAGPSDPGPGDPGPRDGGPSTTGPRELPQPTPPPDEEPPPPPPPEAVPEEIPEFVEEQPTLSPQEYVPPPPPPDVMPEEKPEFVEEKPTPPPKRPPSTQPVQPIARPVTAGPSGPAPPSGRQRGVVKLYFATDREWTGATKQPKWFGSEWNEAKEHLTYGTCDVSIPIDVHKEAGRVEKPSIFRILLGGSEDPKKHVVVRAPERLGRTPFFEALATEVRERDEKEIIVFIHGFNNTFDDAASRLGVLAYDMEFNGVPVLYSWSSRGGALGWTPTAYAHDEEIVTSTEGPLTEFLASVTQTGRAAGAKRVNVVAHSMGNRPLVAALHKLAERQTDRITIDEVVMAAPDVREKGFAVDKWPHLQQPNGPAKRVTLYASSDDQALVMSKRLHGFRRIGEAGNNLLLLPGLDTVDASGCDFQRLGLNHTYFGGRKVISDLSKLIHRGLTPPERDLRKKTRRDLLYWLLPERTAR